jgi:hypothetical protein
MKESEVKEKGGEECKESEIKESKKPKRKV